MSSARMKIMFGGRFLRRVALACAATALAARADPRKLRREILVGFCNVTAPYFDVSAGERCGDFTIVIKARQRKCPLKGSGRLFHLIRTVFRYTVFQGRPLRFSATIRNNKLRS